MDLNTIINTLISQYPMLLLLILVLVLFGIGDYKEPQSSGDNQKPLS